LKGEKETMRNYLKKFIVGLLVMVMTVTGIDYVPANADEVNNYYVGFNGNLTVDNIMTAEDDVYTYTYGQIAKGETLSFGIYTSTAWADVAVAWGNHTADKSGYAKIYYNADTKDVSVKVFTDDTYTTEVSDEPEDVTYYALSGEEYVALDETLTFKYGAVSAGDIVTFGVYTLADELYSEFATNTTEFEKDGYALYTLDATNASISVDLYTDDNYTTKVSDSGDEPSDEVTVYIDMNGKTGLPYFVFTSQVQDFVSAFNPWSGAYAYALTDETETVGENWYSFKVSKAVLTAGFSVYTKVESEDASWVCNVGRDGDSEKIANLNTALENSDTAYAKVDFSVVQSTKEAYEEAMGNVTYTYQIAGSNSDWTEAGIFPSNYGMTDLINDGTGKYYIELGKISENESAKFKILRNNSWSDVMLDGKEQTYTALAEGYVKMIYDPEANTVDIKLYTDTTYAEEVSLDDSVAKVHVYYPGTDTLTIAFWTSTIKSSLNYDKLGTPYGHTYWTRTCYPMTKDEDNWYSFDVYKSYGGFQIVANPQDEMYPDDTYDKENTVWLINVGDAGEGYQNDGDKERYDELFNEGEAYIMYNTLFESKEAAESYDKAFSWDYYISGSTSEFEEACDAGIFTNYWSQDNYGYIEEEGRYKGTENWQDQMTKNGTTLTWISSKKAEKFKSYTLNIYADRSWFGKAGKDFAFLAVADAYVKVTYDLKTKVYSITYFDDPEGINETEFDDITIYYYYGSDDATNLTLVLNATLPGLKVVNTYWGRNAYAMTSIGNGWYQFKGYKALYGGFQIVDNPQGEDYSAGDTADKEGTFWYLDIGDYGDVSTADGDLSKFKDLLNAGNKAYIKYNKIFKTQSAADSFTDWTFYVAGSTTAFGDTDASKGIFSNYWAGNFEDGVDPDTGEAYTKKVDTWPDVFTKVDDSTYYVNLPNKAVKGVKYEFNVYTEKDWNATNLTGTMGAKNPRIEATSSNYIRLYFYRDLKTGATSYAVKYFADKDFKNAVKLSTPTGLKLKKLKATKGAKVKLAWKAVTGASKYTIYANGKKVATSTTNSKVLKYKKQGKTIKYTVKASGSGYAASEASKELKVKTPKKVAKKGIKAKNTKKGIQIKWKKVKAANGYVVYRSTKKKKGFKKVATLKKNSKTKFLDKKAKSGKTYYYKVYAYKKNGKVLVYSDASKTVSAKKK